MGEVSKTASKSPPLCTVTTPRLLPVGCVDEAAREGQHGLEVTGGVPLYKDVGVQSSETNRCNYLQWRTGPGQESGSCCVPSTAGW